MLDGTFFVIISKIFGIPIDKWCVIVYYMFVIITKAKRLQERRGV